MCSVVLALIVSAIPEVGGWLLGLPQLAHFQGLVPSMRKMWRMLSLIFPAMPQCLPSLFLPSPKIGG